MTRHCTEINAINEVVNLIRQLGLTKEEIENVRRINGYNTDVKSSKYSDKKAE